MVRNIVRLLSEEQRRRGVWVVFSVLTRAILDFAGIAALVPILLIVVKDGGRSMMLAVCGVVLLFVLLKNTLVMLVISWKYIGSLVPVCLPIIIIEGYSI